MALDSAYDGDLRRFLDADSTAGTARTPSDVNNPFTACLMEELHHYDPDGNGHFGDEHSAKGDEVAQAIEDALWETREAVDEFKRPDAGWFVDLLMWLMPPQPDRHIVMGYGELKARFRPRHYLLAVVTIVAVIVMVNVQIALVPWTKYSVISGWFAVTDHYQIPTWVAMALFVAFVFFTSEKTSATWSRYTVGFFSKAAAYEE